MSAVEKQIAGLLDRLIESTSQAVIAAFEKRIGELEKRKAVLLEKSATRVSRAERFEELFEHALEFLSNPAKLWNSRDFSHRQLVLRLTFAQRLAYCPETGFQTAKTTMPFKMLADVSHRQNAMARPTRFELF